MNDPDNSNSSNYNKQGIGLFLLLGWHIVSLPFMIWAMITGVGGMICGPSDQFMILFVGIPTDIILLLVSIGKAVSIRKWLHAAMLINLSATIAIILTGIFK